MGAPPKRLTPRNAGTAASFDIRIKTGTWIKRIRRTRRLVRERKFYDLTEIPAQAVGGTLLLALDRNSCLLAIVRKDRQLPVVC